MLFTNTIFKTISVKEMEPNFVRMKVPELKNNLQVWEISVTNKLCEERLDFNFSWISVEAREPVCVNLPSKSETSKETRWIFLPSW